MGKKIRNFILIVLTVGVAYYLWKEHEKVLEQEPFEEVSEPIVDVTEPEEETEEDFALIAAVPEEEAAEAEAEATSSWDEAPAEEQDPISDEVGEELEVPTDELLEEPEPEPVPEPEMKEPTWVKPVDGECPDGFPVKARFATGHFHVPGDRGYDKIVPDCCYPTTEDAEADGFTPSRWA